MKTDYRYATLEVNKKKNTKDNLQYISEARETTFASTDIW